MPPSPSRSSHSKSQRGRILAIDYGRRRIGLALSDELGMTADPLGTLVRQNRREDMFRLRKLARRYDVGSIVVGYPLRLDGRRSEMAEEAARFAARVEKDLGLPVEMRDERLTSWEAGEILKARGGRRRKTDELDSLAAAILLQEHLNSKHGPPRATPRAGA